MGTFSLALEFAGIAASEIVGQLHLSESEAAEALRLCRECCAAAIISALIRQRSDSERQASAASLSTTT